MFSPCQPALSLEVECQKEQEQGKEQGQGQGQEQEWGERGGGTLASGAEGLLAAALARAMAA